MTADGELQGLLRVLAAQRTTGAAEDTEAVVLSPNERIRKLKSVLATAVARKLHTDPAALERLRSTLHVKSSEIEWARSQQVDAFSLGRLVQIALAVGCTVSIDAR